MTNPKGLSRAAQIMAAVAMGDNCSLESIPARDCQRCVQAMEGWTTAPPTETQLAELAEHVRWAHQQTIDGEPPPNNDDLCWNCGKPYYDDSDDRHLKAKRTLAATA